MRIRRKKWARPELEVCPFFEEEPEKYLGQWSSRYKRLQPLHIELGCGKGGFAGRLAADNPDINYLAVDIKSDMLGVARRNIVGIFSESDRQPDNIMLTAYNVEHIEKILSAEDNVERIYINFCNPWPRGKHNKRRLTYPNKLEKFEKCGFDIAYKTYDLHNSDVKDNILTEHEIMFSNEGIKINYCVAVNP